MENAEGQALRKINRAGDMLQEMPEYKQAFVHVGSSSNATCYAYPCGVGSDLLSRQAENSTENVLGQRGRLTERELLRILLVRDRGQPEQPVHGWGAHGTS